MSTHPLIVFSGGMDSSLMLWQALQQGDVHTCYFKGSQHWHKTDVELIARKKIIDYFTGLTGNKVLSDTIVDFQCIGVTVKNRFGYHEKRNEVPDRSWGQAHQWLFGLLFVSDGDKHSKVCVGNLIDDDIAMHYDNMKVAWEYIQRFTKFINVPLEFPLSHWTKDQVLHNLPREIIASTWVCEIPVIDEPECVYKACGECAACRTLMKSIWMWEHRNGRNFKKYVEGTEEMVENFK